MSRVWQRGWMYPLRDPQRYDDEFGAGYAWAFPQLPTDLDASKLYACDAWIVNEQGEVHPGYDVSPVPVRPEALDLDGGKVFPPALAA